MSKWRKSGKWYTSLHNFAEPIVTDFDLPEKFTVRDSTLREGEETPGALITIEDKVRIASLLEEIGVPELEVGVVGLRREEYETLRALKKEGIGMEISAIVTDGPKFREHIDKCVEAGADRITVFVTVSPERLKLDRKFTEEEVLSRVPQEIEYGKARGVKMDIGYTDSTRTELEKLKKAYVVAVEAGADRITVYDTLGIATPDGMRYLVREIKKAVKSRAPILVHCHNDFGIASINTVGGVTGGAVAGDLISNGLGDRGGNCPLEDTVCILEMLYGVDTGIKIDRLTELSKTIEEITKIPRQPNKPIVGVNQFIHETGGHVRYVLRGVAELIEPYTPEAVGQKRQLLFGLVSIDAPTISLKMDQMGLKHSDEDVETVAEKMRQQLKTKNYLTEQEMEEICRATL